MTKAPSKNAFKNRLDKYWKNEEIYYNDYKAEISGSHENRNVEIINNESGEEEP